MTKPTRIHIEMKLTGVGPEENVRKLNEELLNPIQRKEGVKEPQSDDHLISYE